MKTSIIKGKGIVSGFCVGPAKILSNEVKEIPRFWIPSAETKQETKRFFEALKKSKNKLNNLKSKLCSAQDKDHVQILDSQVLMLQDELLIQNTLRLLEKNLINIEWALHEAFNEIKQTFSKIDQIYLRERKQDMASIESLIQRYLAGVEETDSLRVKSGSIIISRELSPAETIELIKFKVGGFILEEGGEHSHTAIIARSLNIPFLIGVKKLLPHVSDGCPLILDGLKGQVIVNPSPNDLKRYQQLRTKQRKDRQKLIKEAQQKAISRDGTQFTLLANIDRIDDLDLLDDYGAEGIGLCRTEFFFLNQTSHPKKEEQKTVYQTIKQKTSPREIIFRTFDNGGDKNFHQPNQSEEPNPLMGLRGIRYGLHHQQLLKEQIESFLEGKNVSEFKICIPMISTIDEVLAFKNILKDRLKTCKVPLRKIKLGVMIETPASLFELDLLMKEVDFFCVGSNDLIQFMLASDRNNEKVASLYSPYHPSIIRALHLLVQSTQEQNKEITLCGETAGDSQYLPLLIGLGFRRLSMNLTSIPKVKIIIRQTYVKKCEQLVTRILKEKTSKEIQKITAAFFKKEFPQWIE